MIPTTITVAARKPDTLLEPCCR